MDNGRYSLIDMLDHQPDSFADSKIKAMMSDIYDNMVGYINNDNSKQVSDIISKYGIKNFIEWFIESVYLPNTEDIKVMSYVNSNKTDIIDVLSQAMSNLSPKEVLDNMEEEKVEGAEEISDKNQSSEDVIENMAQEVEETSEEEVSEYDKATVFIRDLMKD